MIIYDKKPWTIQDKKEFKKDIITLVGVYAFLWIVGKVINLIVAIVTK